MQEIWKDILDYEGLYQVSNLGRIKSLNRKVTQYNGYNYSERFYKGKILKYCVKPNGYAQVGLGKNGKIKWFAVHRLVAQAFIDNLNNEKYINHKDENKLNNKVENLEWCSCSYNINYGTRNDKVREKLIKEK